MNLGDNWKKVLSKTTRMRGVKFPEEQKFGVEIEAEGRNLPQMVFGWNCVPDGSLRGEAMEYVTDGAVSRKDLDIRLSLLEKVAKKAGTRINQESHRASTHIHRNMQHATYREIAGTLLCFLMVEPVFMRLCGANRDGNLFCLPSYDCGDVPKYMGSFAQQVEYEGSLNNLQHRGKYSSLNTMPLNKFGTIEFRTFPCSVEARTVLMWADRVDMVVRRGSAIRNWKETIKSFYENPAPFYRDIFTPDVMEQFMPYELTQMMEVGAENAWDSADAMEKGVAKMQKALQDMKDVRAKIEARAQAEEQDGEFFAEDDEEPNEEQMRELRELEEARAAARIAERERIRERDRERARAILRIQEQQALERLQRAGNGGGQGW